MSFQKPLSSPLFRSFSVVLFAALALAGCGKPQGNGAGPGGPGMQVPVVKVMAVKDEAVPMVVELPGRTSPYLIAELRPQVTGIIQQRLFEEGSEVKAGQLLYQIDPALHQAALDAAEAGLARAEANRHAARLKADRLAGLVETKVASQQEYDDADAGLKQAEAEVAAARAAVDKARIDLDYTGMKSPIDGRIGRSAVTVGALVTANQPQALATVQQLDPIYVDMTQSSAEVSRIRRELNLGPIYKQNKVVAVTLVLEDGEAYRHEGVLAFSEVSVDETTGSLTLRARFANPDGELLPGMYVRARMTLGLREHAIRVPHAAVTRDARGRPQVMVVGQDSKVEERPVTTVQSLGDHWVVTAGLKAGERIIVEGLQKVRPGGEVRVEEPAPVEGQDATPAAKS